LNRRIGHAFIHGKGENRKEAHVKLCVFVLALLVLGATFTVSTAAAKRARESTLDGETLRAELPAYTHSFYAPTAEEDGASAYQSTDLTPVSLAFRQRPRPWDKVRKLEIGSAAPLWKCETAAGDKVSLQEMRGNVVVLDFWANWCAPCRKLEPLFDELVSEYKGKRVRFFTMSIWPDPDFSLQRYLKGRKGGSMFLMCDDKVASDYGIWGVPTYYVIDAAGNISYIHVLLSVDADALGQRLRQAIDKALSSRHGMDDSATAMAS
jgi:thiol-disulfide isomerase/thioredoxin